MSFSTRRNMAVLCACCALLGIFAGIRLRQEENQASDRTTANTVAGEEPRQTPLSVDSSFYATGTTSPGQNTSAGLPKKASTIAAQSQTPVVTAEGYLVGNVATGKIYLSKNPAKVLPVASVSKLLTAIDVTDSYAPTTTIAITPAEADVPADGSQLEAVERFTVSELLYPLLLDSSNVAAEALASSTDRSAFMANMRGYGWEIGMTSSYFEDPSGLSSRNAASADDIFALARYLYTSRPDILALTRVRAMDVATTTDHGAHHFESIHPFSGDASFIGGKTGHTTAAGDTMLTILTIEGQPVAIIVLRSDTSDRALDTTLLRDQVKKLLKK
jgi:D-alanyl-D-alanine endopeptidase (penicillin-binding protein 7)